MERLSKKFENGEVLFVEVVRRYLATLPPGLSRREFIARVSTVVEDATNRLVEAARREQAQLFGRVPGPASAKA